MEMGDTGEWRGKDNGQEWVRGRMQSGKMNERDGDGRHGRMHAGNAAHHDCHGLGPVRDESMKDNE